MNSTNKVSAFISLMYLQVHRGSKGIQLSPLIRIYILELHVPIIKPSEIRCMPSVLLEINRKRCDCFLSDGDIERVRVQSCRTQR